MDMVDMIKKKDNNQIQALIKKGNSIIGQAGGSFFSSV